MMKYVITAMIVLSFISAIFTGRMEAVSTAFLEDCGSAVELAISLVGIIALWSGIMRVAQSSGLTAKLAALSSPVISRLFRGLKKGGKAMQYITLNLTANILGLGNASTPFGIAAMKEIENEEQSKTPEKASHNMIILTVMNTASLQLIPTTVAALRLKNGSSAPMEILPCVWISSLTALITALTAVTLFRKITKRRLR